MKEQLYLKFNEIDSMLEKISKFVKKNYIYININIKKE